MKDMINHTRACADAIVAAGADAGLIYLDALVVFDKETIAQKSAITQ